MASTRNISLWFSYPTHIFHHWNSIYGSESMCKRGRIKKPMAFGGFARSISRLWVAIEKYFVSLMKNRVFVNERQERKRKMKE